METYAQVLTIAIPFFVGLIFIEAFIGYFKDQKVNRPMDTISSLSSGMTFILKQLLGLTIVILSYEWMVEHWSFFNWKAHWWLYVAAFVGLDFAGYWQHRFNHSFNILWNRHVIHHSSEEFNLACALRQNISVIFQVYFFLYIPMALIGVPAKVVAVVAPIQFFAQFWYHTKLINKMGFLEHIIVTPSHHRVHHAINEKYIDKNFAEIFIIWDKLFGTFQEELDDVPAVYGIKKAAQTWNPAIINFQHLWLLIKDAWRTKSLWDKIRIWFMPTGWRPADVKDRFPLDVSNESSQVKYDTSYSPLLLTWIFVQFLIAFLMLYIMMMQIDVLDPFSFALLAVFVFTSIFAYTSMMDGHWSVFPAELIKIGIALYFVNFALPTLELGSWMAFVMVPYVFISMLVTLYFMKFDAPRVRLITS